MDEGGFEVGIESRYEGEEGGVGGVGYGRNGGRV